MGISDDVGLQDPPTSQSGCATDLFDAETTEKGGPGQSRPMVVLGRLYTKLFRSQKGKKNGSENKLMQSADEDQLDEEKNCSADANIEKPFDSLLELVPASRSPAQLTTDEDMDDGGTIGENFLHSNHLQMMSTSNNLELQNFRTSIVEEYLESGGASYQQNDVGKLTKRLQPAASTTSSASEDQMPWRYITPTTSINLEPENVTSIHLRQIDSNVVDTSAARKRKREEPPTTETLVDGAPPATKRQEILTQNDLASRAIEVSHGGDVNEAAELQLPLRSKERINTIQYLPNSENLLNVCENMSLKEAKKKMLAGNLAINGNSVVLIKDCFKPLSRCNYRSLLKNRTITQSDYVYVAPGVYGKTTTDILPTRTEEESNTDNLVNQDWERVYKQMVARDVSLDRGHSVMLAHATYKNNPKNCVVNVWKTYLDQVHENKVCKIASTQNFESPTLQSLLRNGFNNAATPADAKKNFEPRYEVGMALFSTPLQQGNGLDQILVLRQGAPRYYMVFRQEQSSELIKSFHIRVQQYLQHYSICSQLLQHGNFLLSDKAVRDIGVPCVLFRQDVGDAVYIRSGTFWASVDIGRNLIETRYFISPLCYAAISARPKPCECSDNKSVAVTVNEEAKVKATILKPKSVKCRICPIVCKSFRECDRHMVEYHKENYHICNECGATFEKASKLQRHEATHTGIKFKCQECDRFVANMDTHKQTHYGAIICPKCFNIFSYRYMMEYHSKQCRVEEDETPKLTD